MIKARFLPAAEAAFLKEVAYYSNARDGAGVKFHQAVTAAVERAVFNSDGGAPAAKGTRSRIVKGFPFSIVYRVSDLEILVVAVAHHRRQPAYWSGRVR